MLIHLLLERMFVSKLPNVMPNLQIVLQDYRSPNHNMFLEQELQALEPKVNHVVDQMAHLEPMVHLEAMQESVI